MRQELAPIGTERRRFLGSNSRLLPGLFRCGVNVAGVADYAMYYKDSYRGAWTASRIGTPEQNPEVYAKASPTSNIGRLERQILTLHGTSDVNVPYLHAVQLLDDGSKAGKGDLMSFMAYPGEFHYFTREHVLLDAWRRVERFFDANLTRKAGQADWAYCGRFEDAFGRVIPIYAFVMLLGSSRMRFVRFTRFRRVRAASEPSFHGAGGPAGPR